MSVTDTSRACASTVSEVRSLVLEERARRPDGSIALVPTMGALHAGHMALVDEARRRADFVVVSIFVNPLQFGPNEDFDAYPRTLDADVADLANAGVDGVFVPSTSEMFPTRDAVTRVSAGPVGDLYEGRSRSGHFDGMLTAVARLFDIVTPDLAVFGRKDAQQLFLVTRMVSERGLPVEIVGIDTVREPDGLARSSRNRFLSPSERRAAVALVRALRAANSAASEGVDAALTAARRVIASERLVTLDYCVIVDPETFCVVREEYGGPAVVLVAARVGATRLIDNISITVTARSASYATDAS